MPRERQSSFPMRKFTETNIDELGLSQGALGFQASNSLNPTVCCSNTKSEKPLSSQNPPPQTLYWNFLPSLIWLPCWLRDHGLELDTTRKHQLLPTDPKDLIRPKSALPSLLTILTWHRLAQKLEFTRKTQAGMHLHSNLWSSSSQRVSMRLF